MTFIGQHLFIGLKGTSLAKEEADFIVRSNVGGVILFARNVESPTQLRELCLQIQALRRRMPDRAPLFIGVDNEGGRVLRLKAPFTEWPSQALVGKIESTSVAFKMASCMAEELRAVGVNVNFAPCADVLTNPSNPAIGDRAFSSDAETVSKLASAAVRGFIKGGVLPCAKHFPGHGNTSVDSHLELPAETKTLDELRETELVPFKKAMKARLDLIMTAHVLFKNVDPHWPASLSETFSKILREELRFRGLAITDDLGMKAVAARWSVGEVAVQALKAGADLLCYCNEPDAPPAALEAIQKALESKALDGAALQAGTKRILQLKQAKLAQPEPLSAEAVGKIVGHPDHLRLAKAIAAGSVPQDLIGAMPQTT